MTKYTGRERQLKYIEGVSTAADLWHFKLGDSRRSKAESAYVESLGREALEDGLPFSEVASAPLRGLDRAVRVVSRQRTSKMDTSQ